MIGERLAEIRKDHGDTQQDLADKLSVTKFTISNWEQQRSDPSHENLISICCLYNVSADYLLGVSDEDPLLVQSRREKRFTSEERSEIRRFEEFLLWKRKKGQ